VRDNWKITFLEALIFAQRHSTNERKLGMASLESITLQLTSMFHWLIIASNPQTTFSSYFFQVTERTLHFSRLVSLILKGKRATHVGVAVYTSGFPASLSFAKESAILNNGGALPWLMFVD
jgi:hypothetical protein